MLVFYQNVNRIRSKITDVYLNALTCDYDIICLTETNLSSSVYDSELFDSRYNVYRRDRFTSAVNKTEGGGVAVAVKKDIDVSRQTLWDSDVEDLWISILPCEKYGKAINICLCYLPPDLPNQLLKSFYDNLCNVILNCSDRADFICVGDFNIPGLQWHGVANCFNLSASAPYDHKSHLLNQATSLCHLRQFNSLLNANGRLLDLVFSTTEVQVYGVDPLSRLDNHHPALAFKINVNIGSKVKHLKDISRTRYNFNKCKFNEIREELLNTDWLSVLSSTDVDININTFYSIINGIINRHTPLSNNTVGKYPAWFSPALRRSIEMKLKYHKRFKKYGNPLDYDEFAHYRSKSKQLIKNCCKDYVASVESSLTDNVKPFWRFVNSKKVMNSIPLTMRYGDVSASSPTEVCELFSKFFSSVYERVTSISVSNLPTNLKYNATLSGVNISHEMILTKIKKLDASKGPGPDGIPPHFIINCAEEICLPLGILFNGSIHSGTFPTCWKKAHVTPIYKSGDRTDCRNYRPISILSCLAKLFESIVYDVLFSHVKPFLHKQQHGFVANKSTTTNLLEYKDYVCRAFAKRLQVDSVYTDFAKAFDKVNHTMLLKKLDNFGVHGCLLRWLESYLSRRSQLIVVKGHVSKPAFVTSGVPQGSHLGPLLFIIFINDLPDVISCPCLLYADDLKIFTTISNNADATKLQSDLDSLSNWCNRNYMSLNVGKCFVISFTAKKQKIQFDYALQGKVLACNNMARDLGVVFDDKLSFRYHYDNIVDRSNRLLGFLFRSTKHFRRVNSYIYLYYTLIRSILEYNSVVWSPFYRIHSNRIEGVQKQFLRILSFRWGLKRKLSSYDERTKYYRVSPLYIRRQNNDLILLYKIINYRLDSPDLLFLLRFNTRFRSRNPNYNIFDVEVFPNNTSRNNPIIRMCRRYNEVLAINRNIDILNSTLSRFRRQLLELK